MANFFDQFDDEQKPVNFFDQFDEKPKRTWGEALKDTGAQLAEGVNSILGAPADLVAPNSDAAKFFRGNADYWRDQQSDALKQRISTASEAIDAAGEDGVIAQVIEASKQYWNDPALAARFVTTNLPSMIPGIAAVKVAGAAAKTAALARGASEAAAVAKAAAVGATAAGATNAVLNAGGARGDAFDDIKQTLMEEQGLSESDAEAQALKDSRLSAAVGGVAGFVSGKTGLESALVKRGAGSRVAAAVTEMAGEQLEEVSPKLTTNYQAGQYDGRSLGQDVGRTMVETAIGAGPGSVVAGALSPRRNPDATAAQAEADLANAGDVSTMVDAASRLAGAEDLTAAIAEFQQAADVFTGESPAPAPTLDERLGAVKERLSSGELISSLRAIDPGLPQQFLSDFQVARNPNSDTLQRGQALDRIDALLMRTDPETVPTNDADLAGWARSVPFDSLVDKLLNSDQAEFQRILKGAQFDDSRLTATLDAIEERLTPDNADEVQLQTLVANGSYAAQEELARRDSLAQAAPDYYGMALQQLEQQKTGQMDQIAAQARDQQVDQANAMTQAAGVDAGVPTAMGAAFAKAGVPAADNEAGQFSRSRAKTIQGRRADAITDYELQEMAENPSIPSVSRRSAAVELAARREGQPAQQTPPAAPVQAAGPAPTIGLTPAHLMPTPELQRYAKSKGNVGAIARAELERRAVQQAQPVQESAPTQDVPQAERTAPEPTGNADLDAARTALFADGQDVSGIEIAADSGDDISTTATKASAQERTIVKTLAKVFKKRVVLLSGIKEGGFVLKSRPDAIYIGVDAVENHLAIFGHELTHKIKQEYPKLYAALEAVVQASFTDVAEFRRYYNDSTLTDAQLMDEAVGDLIGNRMTEETFWTNVFAKLHAMEGKKAPGIIKRFVESLLSVLRRFKVLAAGRQLFETDAMVQDLDAIKAAAENALAQYLYNVRNGVAPSQVGDNDAEIVFATPKRKDFTNQTLPTRWPTSKKLDPAPSVSDDMITDLETLKKDPLQYSKAVKAIIEEPGMHSPDKVTFEVAPDPRNKALKERWNALPQETKNEISHKVAWKIAAKALASFGDENMKGELHQQLGGWLADTNPSLSIWFNKRAAATKINEFARIMGYALDQMGMMRTSPRPFKKPDGTPATRMGAIQIRLPEGATAGQVHSLYTELREITGKRKKPYISGHTTSDGVMIILNNEEWSGISDEDLTQRVGDRLYGRHDVQLDHIYADFPAKGKDNYGLRTQKGQDRGLGAEPSLRARADQLRAESRVLLEQLVGDVKRSPARRHERSGSGVEDSGAGGRVAAATGDRARTDSARRGEVSLTGVHFSKEPRTRLSGVYFGTGTKSQEAERIKSATDERLKSSIYAYVNEGKGVFPEAGVGAYAHKVSLSNLYDVVADPGDIFTKHASNPNAMESAILDAGFDGYYRKNAFGNQGVAILMGDAAKQGVDAEYVSTDYRGKDIDVVPEGEKSSFGQLQQKVMSNRSLPGGEMTGADWKRLMPKLMPEVDVSHLEDGERYYKNQLVQRPGQVKKSTLRKNFTAKDIPADLEIRIPVEVEETGEVVYLERNGREALQEAEAEATRWKRLYDCLGRAA